MAKVTLQVYDVTNGSEKTNNTVVHINKISRMVLVLVVYSKAPFRCMKMMNGHLDSTRNVLEFLGKNAMFTYGKSRVVILLLLNINGWQWHTYFWITFISVILLLAVGTKLKHGNSSGVLLCQVNFSLTNNIQPVCLNASEIFFCL